MLVVSIVTLGIAFASVFFYMFWRIQSSEQMAALARFSHTKPFLGPPTSYDWGPDSKLLRGMTVSGANLGREPGKGRIVFTRRNDKTGKSVKSEPMDIDPVSIKSWKADRIEFAFSNSMQDSFNSVRENLYRRLPDGDFIPSDYSHGVEIQIITISGEAVSG